MRLTFQLIATTIGSALVLSLSTMAPAQSVGESEAIALARDRVEATLAVPGQSIGPASARWLQLKVGTGTWLVEFEAGITVMIDDSRRPHHFLVRSGAANLNGLEDEVPFQPAYKTVDEAVSFVRSVAARLGLRHVAPSQYSPPQIPVPDGSGFVRKRHASVGLYQTAHGYLTIMGGNRIEATFDTRDYTIGTVAVVTGYTYETPAGSPLAESDAEQGLRSIEGFGSVELAKGPGYYEILDSGFLTPAGSLYASEKTLPLVYVFRSREHLGVVHAVSGELLRHQSRALDTGSAKTSSSLAAANAARTRPAQAARGLEEMPSGPASHRNNIVFTVGLMLAAIAGGVAWYTLRRNRGRRQ